MVSFTLFLFIYFIETISPALENTLSKGTESAGVAKYWTSLSTCVIQHTRGPSDRTRLTCNILALALSVRSRIIWVIRTQRITFVWHRFIGLIGSQRNPNANQMNLKGTDQMASHCHSF